MYNVGQNTLGPIITQKLAKELDEIIDSIASGTYCAGTWQRKLRDLSAQDRAIRQSLKPKISAISDALHGRHEYKRFSFLAAYLIELSLIAAAIWLSSESLPSLRLLATILFAVTLQPALKVTTGLFLGVRYSYAYLWYFEPRFKMKYGDYLACSTWRRLVLQFSGSLGTPVAMAIGMILLLDSFYLFWFCAAGLVAFSLMQLIAFVAAVMGVKRIGPMNLRHLTSPAVLGFELRQAMK